MNLFSPRCPPVESIVPPSLVVSLECRFRRAFRRRASVILLSSLVLFGLSDCTDGVDAPASSTKSDDYWPLLVGSKWKFDFSSSFRDWDVSGVGMPIEGSYVGTLTWEIVSTTETQNEARSTFKQRFVGVATELQLRSLPNDYVTVNYNIVDTTIL